MLRIRRYIEFKTTKLLLTISNKIYKGVLIFADDILKTSTF